MTGFEKQRRAMVDRQLRDRGICSVAILSAFSAVPRERFVPEDMREFAYRDGPLPIGEGQTISQPFIVAQMIDAAEIGERSNVLEVGAGSGYAAAVMSRIAKRVLAIERHEVLARRAARIVAELGYDNCTIRAGDGMEGAAKDAPFDAILVAARCSEIPVVLKDQLAPGGRLVVPVGPETAQSLICLQRTGPDEWEERDLGQVRFVPLLPGTVEGGIGERPDASI